MSFVFGFNLPDNPMATAQQKGVDARGRRPRFYTKASVLNVQQMYKLAILQEFNRLGVPLPYLEGPVGVSVKFTFAVKERRRWGHYKDTKPDCDNLVKILLDVLTGLHLWRDDAAVAVLRVEKRYGEYPRVDIELEELKNDV